MKSDIWAPLAEGCQPQKWAAGRLIYLQDTEADQFYYILSGTVKCFISSPEGDERTLTLHHSGELIGEAAFFDRQPRASSAVAVSSRERARTRKPVTSSPPASAKERRKASSTEAAMLLAG